MLSQFDFRTSLQPPMTALNEDLILPRVQSMLRERFALSEAQVDATHALTELGVDSLAVIEFMFDLETEFDISLSQERADIHTIGDIAALVRATLDKTTTQK